MHSSPQIPRSRTLTRSLAAIAVVALVGCEMGSHPDRTTPPAATKEVATEPEPTAARPPEVQRPAPAANSVAPASGAAPPPLFEGWPKPAVALVLTGQQLGYIEPCGCTGLENQKGGLARRHSLIKQLAEERGWPLVPLDVGSQVRRYGKQSELKFQHTAEALRTMGYRAVALGGDDLRLPASELLNGTNPPNNQPSIFVGANVALISRDLQPRWTVVTAGGKKIGVTAILGEQHERQLQSDEIEHEPTLAALAAVSRELQEQKCDLYVLLAHLSRNELPKVAAAAQLFDLIVVAGQTSTPSIELESVEGAKAKIVHTGVKGMYATVVGVFDDPAHPLRLQSVPLDAKLNDSPAMLKLLADYQEQLKALGLEGLGLAPRPHPSGRTFVGSEKCGECHTKAYGIWSNTPHAHATDSLVKPPNARGDIARHFDPECLSCHVTGWDPQQFHPFDSGYLSLEQTPLLKHNGCENCHGPGSAHVAAEEGAERLAAAEIAKRRGAMKLPLAGGVAERKCLECHDDDNSPDFHVKGAFERYWKEVEHSGKD